MLTSPVNANAGQLATVEVSGLDLRQGALSSPRGSLRDVLNFEMDQQGGLVRSKGWAKYDGTVMGPDLEQAVIVSFLPGAITGAFLYGELVNMSLSGLPLQQLICIGQANVGFGNFLVLAYPYTDYTGWVDPTSFGTGTNLLGTTSLATINGVVSVLTMTDNTYTIAQYNAIKKAIATMHSAAVKQVPGDPLRPIDAVFTFNNDVFAVHDCWQIPFNVGNGTGFPFKEPVEGHWIRDQNSGATIGRILRVDTLSGRWANNDAGGIITLYDVPLNVAPFANGQRFDAYDAQNVAIVQASFCRYTTGAVISSSRTTRAMLYKTTDQAVKTNAGSNPPPATYMNQTPVQTPAVIRTWTRPRCTREIPYTQKYQGLTVGAGFAPVGANDFSIYEYSRQGITPGLAALNPITAPEKFPTTVSQPGTNPWLNPNNLLADDGVFTTIVIAGAQSVPFIMGQALDFSFIPPGSRILGLSVRVKGLSSVANSAYFANLQLLIPDATATNGYHYSFQDKGGNTPGNTLSAANTSYTFGSSADLWGEVITPAMLQDPRFGVFIKMRATAASTLSLDCLTVTVTYVPPSRTVYIRNTGSTSIAVTDVPVNILHYSIDQGSFTDAGNPANGVLTFWVMQTAAGATANEGDATNAGMARVIGAGEEIWTGPGATGTKLGYTSGGHYPITLPAGALLDQMQSRYEVIDANFYDDVNARAAFMVNGIEFCTMFDGTYTLRARTGRPTDQDNPRHVANHLGYLHLGFASGAVVNCGTNRPLSVIGAPGSNTYNFGEPVTGLLTLNGQTLGVWTDRKVRGLQGSSPAPDLGGYTPIIISPAINCIEYSLASVMGEAVWMSFRGVETVRTITAYGDFETLPLSAKASSWLEDRIQVDRKIATTPSRLIYSFGVRNKRQYRAAFGDGYMFCLTMFDSSREPEMTILCLGRPIAAATFPDYGVQTYLRAVVRHVYQGTRTDGKEIILACFENLSPVVIGSPNFNFPFAVELECGAMWDIGLDMPCWIDFNALYFGDPQQQAKYQSLSVFINALPGTQLRAYTLVNFDGPMDVNPLVTSDPNVNTTRITLPQWPAANANVRLPVPQVVGVIDIPATGRMIRLRIDANQDVDSNVTTCPVRITHLGFQLEPERVDRS
jgi:hypothetical protein